MERVKVTPAPPPVAPERPHVLEAHGDRRVDPYYWLREKQNPDVVAYLEAENAFADDVMADAMVFKYIPAPLTKQQLGELIQIPERK